MSKYDIHTFPATYCEKDIRQIATAVQNNASMILIGMPGNGKSRLIDFFIHRPDILERFQLKEKTQFARVDGDTIGEDITGMYIRLYTAVHNTTTPPQSRDTITLKDQILWAVATLPADTNLVVVFDNFRPALQPIMGEDFFNFLFALRNSRAHLNISYLFLANLQIDKTGFFKLERLFDQGIDHAICWLSLLNEPDTMFSIDRQLNKAGQPVNALTPEEKRYVYAMSGGHALLNRYLSHLMLQKVIDVEDNAANLLAHGSIQAACQAVWDDLSLQQKNLAIDFANDPGLRIGAHHILKNYGVITTQNHFFSPIFQKFVQSQRKGNAILDIYCDEMLAALLIETEIGQTQSYSLTGLSSRKRKLLNYLCHHYHETCTKNQLKDVGWTVDDLDGVTDQALGRQIDDIRSWLRNHDVLSQKIIVESAWGVGYRLVPAE